MTIMRAHPLSPLMLALAAGAIVGCASSSDQPIIDAATTNSHANEASAPEGAPAPTIDLPAPSAGADPTPGSLILPTDGAIPEFKAFASVSPPFNPATSLYGEVMAKAMANSTQGTNMGGGNFTQVSFSQEGADFDPSVSRDGSQIVFASTQHRTTSDIFIKSVQSRVVTQLTNDPANDVMPRTSPDGTRIAFASNRSGNWDIYVIPITGGRTVQITCDAADDLHPSWSPSGAQLVFCRLGEVSGQWEMWVTDVGNTGVARFIGYGLFPEWCPIGGTGAEGADRIAFQRSRERGDRAFGVWTVDYKNGEAGNMTEVASSPVAACINPAWAPDGQWIAFATVPNPSEWANSLESRPASADLWMADLNGTTRISLTSGKAVNLMPTWGPGNRLFFVSDRGGTDNIWSMDTTKVLALARANMKSDPALAGTPIRPQESTEKPVATAPGEDHR
jgi:TolB protein